MSYKTETLNVRTLIEEAASDLGIEVEETRTRRERLMRLGTRLREASGDGAFMAMLAVKTMMEPLRSDPGGQPRAFILRSLKHSDEIELLRQVYGSRFVLVGATAPRSVRQDELIRVFRETDHLGPYEAESESVKLMDTDEHERETELGQQIRKAFPQADVFMRVPLSGSGVEETARRVVKLLFGYPFETPTMDEQAMFYAYAASLRSSALGRQVGCSLVDTGGEVVATGTNEVPRPGGGQYWAGDQPDGRDFVRGREASDVYNEQLLRELISGMKDGGWLTEERSARSMEELVDDAVTAEGPAGEARLLDVLEFGRVIHAEMAALMTAARRGDSVTGASLFTTTFPCHECARLIVAAGVMRVVYREPYPKSRVIDLYPDSIAVDEIEPQSRVAFEPFVGVAPRLFTRVFEAGERKDSETGAIVEWDSETAGPRLEGYEEEATGYLTPKKERDVVGRLEAHLDRLKA